MSRRTTSIVLAGARAPLVQLITEKELAALDAGVAEKEVIEIAESTQKAYKDDWGLFEEWCARRGMQPNQADAREIARFLEYLFITPREKDGEPRKITGIKRALSGVIYTLRRRYGVDWISHSKFSVLLKNMKIRRAKSVGEDRRAATPIWRDDLAKMLMHVEQGTFGGKRDRALLLWGWMGAFRRGELAALTLEDLKSRTDQGIRVQLKYAKTDPTGEKSWIYVPALPDPAWCPVLALDTWLEAAKITSGSMFRGITRAGTLRANHLTGHAEAKIVARIAKKAGLKGAVYSGHSLRRGWACQAYRDGIEIDRIRQHLRHSDTKTTMLYIAEAIAASDSATREMMTAPKAGHR